MAERPQNPLDEATVDLLIKQVTEGLSPAEQRELDVLDSAVASEWLRDLELAAAAITVAGSGDANALPAALAQSIALQADQHFAASRQVPEPTAAAADRKIADLEAARAIASLEKVPRVPAGRNSAYGWLAAAACLVLAAFGWLRTPVDSAPPVAQIPPPPVVTAPIVKPVVKPVVPPTPAEERVALLAKAETIKITLGGTKDPGSAGMTGDVVWDPATQRGYMHFTGLAANDPAIHQYQIWIFDGSRDKRYPVDGGVFDVPANSSDVVIPIRATLMVRKPAAFAVTVEKPGGTMVSGREHIVALGAAG
jgi:Anti-sigma-K factor rskA